VYVLHSGKIILLAIDLKLDPHCKDLKPLSNSIPVIMDRWSE